MANNGGVPLTNLTQRIYFSIYANGSTGTDNTWSAWYHSQMKVIGSLYALPNQPPTNIVLSNTNVPENLAIGTTVGAFSTQDPDAGNTFVYALTNGAGGTDNGSFTISGSNLQTAASFNYEVKSNYSILVQSTDQGLLFTQKVFAITVSDVNETPTFVGLTAPTNGNMVLRWSSVTNHLYTIHSSTNLLTGFSVLQSNITATPSINSYTDSVQTIPSKFWKISTVETQENFAWKRYDGNPVITWDMIPSPPGALYPVMGDPAILYEDGKFKMWFGYGGLDNTSDTNSTRVRTAYAESDDSMHWKVISASSLDVGGSNDWDRTNAETPSVINDEILPAGHPQKYRMYYAGMDNAIDKLPPDEIIKLGMGYGIGLAFSSDGKNFTRLPASESPYGVKGLVLKPNPPQPSGSQWDLIHVADPHVLVKDGIYHMWYSSFSWDEAAQKSYITISYATSKDGITWEKYGHIFKPDLSWETDRPEAHVGRPYVFFRNGRFEMFYDAAAKVKIGENDLSAGTGFAFSLDGKTWTKEQEPIFTSNYGKGEKLGIMIGSGYFLKDSVYYMYYPGLDPDEYHFAFNLATWTPEI